MKAVIALVGLMIVGSIIAFSFIPELRLAAWTFFTVGITTLVTKIVDKQLAKNAAESAVKKMSVRPPVGEIEDE